MILIAHMARCSPPRHSVALIHLQALPLSFLAGSESAGSSTFRHKKPHLLQRGYAKQCSSLPHRGTPPLGRRKATEFCSLLLWPQHPVEKREVAEFSSSPHRTPSPGKQLCQILFSPSQGNPCPRKKKGRGILSPSSEAATSSGRNRSCGLLFSSPQETLSPAKKLCGALLFSPSQGCPSPSKKQGQDALFLDKENCSPYPRCSNKGSVPNRNKELQMFLTALSEEAKKGIEV
jgi:hypothetical protein